MLKFFLPQPDPKELVRKWQSSLRAEERGMDRQIREIKLAEKKVQKEIKDCAKRGDMNSARVLAKEILATRKAVSRMYTNKAQLMDIGITLTQQMAMVKVAGVLGKSTEVMKAVNEMIKLPALQKIMMEMSKEMMKAGLIDEMMGEAMDSAMDTEDMEEETEAQVEAILAEVAGETLASLPAARKAKAAQAVEDKEQEDDMDELNARLNAVRS